MDVVFFCGRGCGRFDQRSRRHGSSLVDGGQDGQRRQLGHRSQCGRGRHAKNWQLRGQRNNYEPISIDIVRYLDILNLIIGTRQMKKQIHQKLIESMCFYQA